MNNNNFSYSVSAKISAAEAISKISNITGWWAVTLDGTAQQQGDTFVIRMGDEAFFNCTVSELAPGKRLVWAIADSYMPWFADKKEWSNTNMVFDVKEQGGVTEIIFTHEGLTPAIECYKDCEEGWTHWIGTSLKSYLETGVGVFRKPTK